MASVKRAPAAGLALVAALAGAGAGSIEGQLPPGQAAAPTSLGGKPVC